MCETKNAEERGRGGGRSGGEGCIYRQMTPMSLEGIPASNNWCSSWHTTVASAVLVMLPPGMTVSLGGVGVECRVWDWGLRV